MSLDQHPAAPFILSMEVDDDNEFESDYRVQIGTKVKYLKIAAATFDRDILSFPLASLPPLSYDDDSWIVAHISRDADSGDLRTSLSGQKLAGVQNIWHSAQIDVLDLERTDRLTASTFEAVVRAAHSSTVASALPLQARVVAKIARFEWEVPRIERETRAYQILQQRAPDLAPRFLGHVREGERVMGFLLEKVEDCTSASIGDLGGCELALGKLHGLGLLHGDVNRYNFLVGKDGIRLIDFECFQENATEKLQRKELQSLRAELVDQSGRGAGFIFSNLED